MVTKTPLIRFFRGLTRPNKTLLILGSISAVLAGMILPSISLFMGNIAMVFSGSEEDQDSDDMLVLMGSIGGIVILVALAIFAFSYMFYAFWQHLAANITNELKKKYIEALMRQEIGYFERNKVE